MAKKGDKESKYIDSEKGGILKQYGILPFIQAPLGMQGTGYIIPKEEVERVEAERKKAEKEYAEQKAKELERVQRNFRKLKPIKKGKAVAVEKQDTDAIMVKEQTSRHPKKLLRVKELEEIDTQKMKDKNPRGGEILDRETKEERVKTPKTLEQLIKRSEELEQPEEVRNTFDRYMRTKPDGSPASIWDVEEPEKYKKDIFDED